MKNNTEIKQEIIKYLTSVSNHLYMNSKNQIVKIILAHNSFVVITGDDYVIHNIDYFIRYYAQYSKSVIKDHLFLNKKFTSIRKFESIIVKHISLFNDLVHYTKVIDDRNEMITILDKYYPVKENTIRKKTFLDILFRK